MVFTDSNPPPYLHGVHSFKERNILPHICCMAFTTLTTAIAGIRPRSPIYSTRCFLFKDRGSRPPSPCTLHGVCYFKDKGSRPPSPCTLHGVCYFKDKGSRPPSPCTLHGVCYFKNRESRARLHIGIKVSHTMFTCVVLSKDVNTKTEQTHTWTRRLRTSAPVYMAGYRCSEGNPQGGTHTHTRTRTRTHTHARARTHTHTRARARAHTHTRSIAAFIQARRPFSKTGKAILFPVYVPWQQLWLVQNKATPRM